MSGRTVASVLRRNLKLRDVIARYGYSIAIINSVIKSDIFGPYIFHPINMRVFCTFLCIAYAVSRKKITDILNFHYICI